MSVSAVETREEKLNWLLRPLNWASTVCFYGAAMSGLMWFDGNVSTETIAIVATTALFVTLGLLLWSAVRTTRAARGQY
jgi:hypothetical protein